MHFALALGLCFLFSALAPASAQFTSTPGTLTVNSRSGQFVIQAASAAKLNPLLVTNHNLVRLEPTVLAVSCERIKQNLWRDLGIKGAWQSRIYIRLYPATSTNDTVTISVNRFKDGWRYHLLVPDFANPVRYVRAMTQVVLLEFANRSAADRSAEIPTWLIEGLSRELLASAEANIIIPPPDNREGGTGPSVFMWAQGYREDPLSRAHQDLLAHPALSFQQLSWLADDELIGPSGEFYRSNAQLFVDRLLRLKNGRANLCAFLSALPEHYNWQFAFLHAFQEHFSRPIAIDKWWDLQVADFTGRSLVQTWPLEESWRKLDDTIRSAVQVRLGTNTNEAPLHAQAPLQSIIRDCDRAQQTPVLQNKLRELELVRLRASPELVPVINSYRQVLATYLQNRDKTGFPLHLRKKAAQRHATEEALKQLSALDARRLALRPEQQVIAPAAAARSIPAAATQAALARSRQISATPQSGASAATSVP